MVWGPDHLGPTLSIAVAGAITVHVSAKPKDISDGRKITAVASQAEPAPLWHCVTLALFINVLIIIIIIVGWAPLSTPFRCLLLFFHVQSRAFVSDLDHCWLNVRERYMFSRPVLMMFLLGVWTSCPYITCPQKYLLSSVLLKFLTWMCSCFLCVVFMFNFVFFKCFFGNFFYHV